VEEPFLLIPTFHNNLVIVLKVRTFINGTFTSQVVVLAFIEEKSNTSNNNTMPNTNVSKDSLRFLV
jgi:hypothetical protein